MNLLEMIGIGAIVVAMFFVIKRYNYYQKEKHEQFTEKAKILIENHSELNKILTDYLKEEENRISIHNNVGLEDRDVLFREKGGIGEIFGVGYRVFNYDTSSIEKIISDRIKALEKDVKEKEFIEFIIEKTKTECLQGIKTYEIELYETKAKLIKYGETLNSMFPNRSVKLSKEEIIENLANNLKTTHLIAESAFNNLIKPSHIFLQEDVFRGDKTVKYWYDETFAKEKIWELQKHVKNLTLKYH